MKDRLGSIINIMDASETLRTTYSYDAFGQPTATYHSGQVDCMYRFTGRVYDGAMGNYFYRARYYNQSLGRFFSRDPIMSLGSLYAYCGNSPANFTDPFGMLAGNVIGGNLADTPMGMYLPWYVGPWLPCAGWLSDLVGWAKSKVKGWIDHKAANQGTSGKSKSPIAVIDNGDGTYTTKFDDGATGPYDASRDEDLPLIKAGGDWWDCDDVIGYMGTDGKAHTGDQAASFGQAQWTRTCFPLLAPPAALEGTIFTYKMLFKGLRSSYYSWGYGGSGDLFGSGGGDADFSSSMTLMGIYYDDSWGMWRFDPSGFQF